MRRSPDPEEIAFEMARDKGYGGRSKRTQKSENIMHRSQKGSVTVEDEQMSQRSGHAQWQSRTRECSPPGTFAVPVRSEENMDNQAEPAVDKVVASGVLTITEEQLAQHPMVIRMMQRLEALERRHNQSLHRGETLKPESISKAVADEISERLPIEEEVGEHVVTANKTQAKQVSILREVALVSSFVLFQCQISRLQCMTMELQ